MELIDSHVPRFWEEWKKIIRHEMTGMYYTRLCADYMKAYYFDSKFVSHSFIIEDDGAPLLAACLVAKHGPDGNIVLTGHGMPILYWEDRKSQHSRKKKARRLFKSCLDQLLSDTIPDKIIYRDLLSGGNLSFLSTILLDAGAHAKPYFTQIIDLSQQEDSLRKEIRKSYRSLINWGEKNLDIKLITKEKMAVADIEAFRQLHIEEAGCETRPAETWDIQREMICKGEAFSVFGFLDGDLVTAALFLYNSISCYYWVSASRRDMFEKPISHGVLWRAILFAKSLGCRFFEMGEQKFCEQGNPRPSQKELGISTFKRGFGGRTKMRVDIVLEP